MELGKRSGRIIASAMMLAFFPGAATAASFGKENEKINLVVGYQPYYTEAWSGVVNNGKKFWKKYLPEGSTASFQVGLQGAVIVNSMTGEKQHIGYVGDMPGIVATFQSEPSRGGTDIRIVGVLGTSKQQCNVFLVRNEAPEFKSGREARDCRLNPGTGRDWGQLCGRSAGRAWQAAFHRRGLSSVCSLPHALRRCG